MIVESLEKLYLWRVGFMIASLFLATVVVIAGEHECTILVLTYSLPMMKEECHVFAFRPPFYLTVCSWRQRSTTDRGIFRMVYFFRFRPEKVRLITPFWFWNMLMTVSVEYPNS
jgi:hypothetical protein